MQHFINVKERDFILYGCETWSLNLRENLEGVSDQGDENVWTQNERSNMGMEKTA
jgi:hypothetical protein